MKCANVSGSSCRIRCKLHQYLPNSISIELSYKIVSSMHFISRFQLFNNGGEIKGDLQIRSANRIQTNKIKSNFEIDHQRFRSTQQINEASRKRKNKKKPKCVWRIRGGGRGNREEDKKQKTKKEKIDLPEMTARRRRRCGGESAVGRRFQIYRIGSLGKTIVQVKFFNWTVDSSISSYIYFPNKLIISMH